MNNGGQGLSENGGFQTVQRRTKRKKVSSSNMDTFANMDIDSKLVCMFEKMNVIEDTISECRNDIIKVNSNYKLIDARVYALEQTMDWQVEMTRSMCYHSIDRDARDMRNNIIIYGLSERLPYNDRNLVLKFLENELEIDTSDMMIDRAHRLGRKFPNTNDQKRPMIARFRDYIDTETILSNAYKLKRTHFGLDRQYPKEIARARKELYQSKEAEYARMSNQRVKIKYPAELFINDRSIENKFPEWFNVLGVDRLKRCPDTKPTQSARVYSNETVINSSSESDSNDGNDQEAADEDVFLKTQEKSIQPIVGNAHENVNKPRSRTNSADRIEQSESVRVPVNETHQSVSRKASLINKSQIPTKTIESRKTDTSNSVKHLKTKRAKMAQSQPNKITSDRQTVNQRRGVSQNFDTIKNSTGTSGLEQIDVPVTK
ncbi:hypothetical protein DPMN_042996 [Dreissena polymorpha]|uniref:Uncharacterized protein n=1 Tax=Dreissena polymorpha TaxID=45954 RepID=A0A9D4HXJ1_DREPO|nr:hypothetical protein DPMN_042996 [Dreissena polymorpha]